MILVFIILGIIIFITLTMFLLTLSKVKFDIKELKISNADGKFKVDFILEVAIYLFNKFKIIKFTITDRKVSKALRTGKIDIRKFKYNKQINEDVLKTFKQIEFKIEYFKLDGQFATFNTVLSSWIFGILNAIIPILIAPKIRGKYINNIEFININENIINININCIISVKMVNIINILHYLIKKGGKNNGKSSDRRTYAYSNE